MLHPWRTEPSSSSDHPQLFSWHLPPLCVPFPPVECNTNKWLQDRLPASPAASVSAGNVIGEVHWWELATPVFCPCFREWSLHLWTEAGRTCSFSVSRCRDKEREVKTLTASLAWRSFSFSARILCCSALSALRFSCREQWQRHWITTVALPASTATPHYQELCFIECEPPSPFLERTEGSLCNSQI